MGLDFPGGPKIEALAKRGDPRAVRLPRAELPRTYNFSFSGLKTAEEDRDGGEGLRGEIRSLLSGGVAANSSLRERMRRACEEAGLELFIPPPFLCTDNAAMIAAAGCFKLGRGQISPLDLDIEAEARLGEV